MKTPQEAAREYATRFQSLVMDSIEEEALYQDDMVRMFLAGVAWADRWISVMDELPDDDTLILTKDTDCHIDLIRGWQLKERIKPYAVQNFYTHWRPIEPVNK